MAAGLVAGATTADLFNGLIGGIWPDPASFAEASGDADGGAADWVGWFLRLPASVLLLACASAKVLWMLVACVVLMPFRWGEAVSGMESRLSRKAALGFSRAVPLRDWIVHAHIAGLLDGAVIVGGSLILGWERGVLSGITPAVILTSPAAWPPVLALLAGGIVISSLAWIVASRARYDYRAVVTQWLRRDEHDDWHDGRD